MLTAGLACGSAFLVLLDGSSWRSYFNPSDFVSGGCRWLKKKLTGKIARERIRSMETPLSPEGVIEGFRALGDASGIVSDVMDELGITGIIGASVLKPTLAGSRVVGPALTVHNI